MKTLAAFVDVEGLSDLEFEQLLRHIFDLPGARGRLKFNVFEQSRDEVIAITDELHEVRDATNLRSQLLRAVVDNQLLRADVRLDDALDILEGTVIRSINNGKV